MNTSQSDQLPSQQVVALRSEDSGLIGLVRDLIAPFGLPLTVYPLGATPPRAAVVFDSANEQRPGDPSWQGAGQIFASLAAEDQLHTQTTGVIGGESAAPPALRPSGIQARYLPRDAPILTRQLEWVVATNLAPVLGGGGGKRRGGSHVPCNHNCSRKRQFRVSHSTD